MTSKSADTFSDDDNWSDDDIAGQDDSAPTAVSFAQSTKDFRNTIEQESLAQKRHLQSSKKRKPKWAQKTTQMSNQRRKKQNEKCNTSNDMNTIEQNDDDSKLDILTDTLQEPPLKKQRLNTSSKNKDANKNKSSLDVSNMTSKPQIGWISESDMFGKSENNSNSKGNKNKNKNKEQQNDGNKITNKNSDIETLENIAKFHNLTESNNLSKANLALFNNDDWKSNDNNKYNSEATLSSTIMTESKKAESEKNGENDDGIGNDKDADEDVDDNDDGLFDFNSMPLEVLQAFSDAINKNDSKKEIEDKWRKIFLASMEKNSLLKKKKSQFDKIFVENGMFEIRVHNTVEKNVSALRRALRIKTFTFTKHRRRNYNKQRSMGRYGPSYNFNQDDRSLKRKVNNPDLPNHIGRTVWGQKNKHIQEKTKQDDLSRWLNEW